MKVTSATRPHFSRSITNNSNSGSPGNKECEAQRRIDQEIAKHEETIQALKSRRNSYALTCQLPPEILCKIFLACSFTTSTYSPYNWIIVTQICRHWRAVGLSCPELWSNIVMSRPRWVGEMVRRSKMAAISVNADVKYLPPKMVEALHLVLGQIPRTRELSLTSVQKSVIDRFLGELSNPAPILECLVLAALRNDYGMDENLVIPENLLQGDAPRLRSLDLSFCDIKWNSPLLKGLTSLRINHTSVDARPSMSELLDVMEQLPDLQKLDLSQCLPLTGDNAPTGAPDRIISLSYLSLLSVSATVPESENFLRRIALPPNTTVKLVCKATAATNNKFSGILSIFASAKRLPSNGNAHPRLPIRSLQISCRHSSAVLVKAWPDVISDISSVRPAPIDLTLHAFDSTKTYSILADIYQTLPLEQLRILCVNDANFDFDAESWVKTFGRLRHLDTIQISGYSTHELISALTFDFPVKSLSTEVSDKPYATHRKRKSADVPETSFPALQKLLIHNTDFDGDHTEAYFEVEGLVDCLIERYERGVEIRKLGIEDCTHLLEEHVDQFREIVVDLEWDEVEQGFSEEYDFDEEEDEDYYTDGYGGDHFIGSDDDYIGAFGGYW
ncbi:hypothetical protein BDQ12DRAFT_628705 [Crucibulum laeve]|uniref:F-box domain-containing protein n=1 Tax=Crucibulum laeve TaxID=68775 RepID=A0A5C3M2Z5_9AGAR|nr:hypothetical protein BDQ12DRAFT_628705 [Crucibulum laeve]